MKKFLFPILMYFGLCMTINAQSDMIELTLAELNSLYQIQSRDWKSVHDPSLVWDATSQTFYIYGSHYEGAQTKDFKTYSSITRYYKGGYDSGNAYQAFQNFEC